MEKWVGIVYLLLLFDPRAAENVYTNQDKFQLRFNHETTNTSLAGMPGSLHLVGIEFRFFNVQFA
jgi:hypothetical protein